MDRGGWWATVHGVAKSQTQLSNFHFHFLTFTWHGALTHRRVVVSSPDGEQGSCKESS